MSSADLNEMLNALWLTDEIHWDLALYGIVLINIILLFVLPDGSTLGMPLAVLVITCAVIDKVHGFGYMLEKPDPIKFHEEVFFGTYLIRVIICLAPALVAGNTESSKARVVGILAFLGGGAYMIARWYVEQRNVPDQGFGIGFIPFDFVPQVAGMMFVMWGTSLRSRLRWLVIDRDVPAPAMGDPATHSIKIERA